MAASPNQISGERIGSGAKRDSASKPTGRSAAMLQIGWNAMEKRSDSMTSRIRARVSSSSRAAWRSRWISKAVSSAKLLIIARSRELRLSSAAGPRQQNMP